jgi:hypothetical protein
VVLCHDGQLVPSGCCQSLYTGIVWNSTKSFVTTSEKGGTLGLEIIITNQLEIDGLQDISARHCH